MKSAIFQKVQFSSHLYQHGMISVLLVLKAGILQNYIATFNQIILISSGFCFRWTSNQSSNPSLSCRTFWFRKTLLMRMLLGVYFVIEEICSQLIPIVYLDLQRRKSTVRNHVRQWTSKTNHKQKPAPRSGRPHECTARLPHERTQRWPVKFPFRPSEGDATAVI